MKHKHKKKFFYKRFVVLFILLAVVCFSLGASYSNFIYTSSNHRAVEMHMNKLSYNIKVNNVNTNSLEVFTGKNVYNVSITSLNDVNTYYKVALSQNVSNYYYDGEASGLIVKNGSINFNLVIDSSFDTIVNIEVFSGYATNSLEEVVVSDNYYEVNNKLSVGDYVSYNNFNNQEYVFSKENTGYIVDQYSNPVNVSWVLYDILDNGEIELISNEPIKLNDYELYFSGSSGYNNVSILIHNYINDVYAGGENAIGRNINVFDVISKTNNDYNTYVNSNGFKYNDINRYEVNMFYPHKWKNEVGNNVDGIINNGITSESLSNEYFKANNFIEARQTFFTYDVSNMSSEYYNILVKDKAKYYLDSMYTDLNYSYVNYGIFMLDEESIYGADLYDSNDSSYVSNASIRPIITLSNVSLYKENNLWKIKETN